MASPIIGPNTNSSQTVTSSALDCVFDHHRPITPSCMCFIRTLADISEMPSPVRRRHRPDDLNDTNSGGDSDELRRRYVCISAVVCTQKWSYVWGCSFAAILQSLQSSTCAVKPPTINGNVVFHHLHCLIILHGLDQNVVIETLCFLHATRIHPMHCRPFENITHLMDIYLTVNWVTTILPTISVALQLGKLK